MKQHQNQIRNYKKLDKEKTAIRKGIKQTKRKRLLNQHVLYVFCIDMQQTRENRPQLILLRVKYLNFTITIVTLSERLNHKLQKQQQEKEKRENAVIKVSVIYIYRYASNYRSRSKEKQNKECNEALVSLKSHA